MSPENLSLRSLTVEAGGEISGAITLDGQPLEPEAGETYTGQILVKGAEPQETEAQEEDSVEAPAEVMAQQPVETPAAQERAPEPVTVPEEPAAEHSSGSGTVVIAVALGVVALAIIFGAAAAAKKKKK